MVDAPSSMTPAIARVHPFPEHVTLAGLDTVSRALETRRKLHLAAASTSSGASTKGGDASASEADPRDEVWRAAERLIQGMGDGTASYRSPGSLLASLLHLRSALRRHEEAQVGDSSGEGRQVGHSRTGGPASAHGAWEVMSSGPKGATLARAAVGAVVRLCRSERAAVVHLEATRLAGEVSAYSLGPGLQSWFNLEVCVWLFFISTPQGSSKKAEMRRRLSRLKA